MLRLRLLLLAVVRCGAEEFQVVTERICSGTESEYAACGDDVPDCDSTCNPVNCTFGDWTDWSVPLMGCEGLCTRDRTIKSQNNDCGASCEGTTSETKNCTPASPGCVIVKQDCVLNDWTDWSSCADSPLNQQIRERKLPHVLLNATLDGIPCHGNLSETVPCAEPEIADCTLGDWSAWTACTKPCGRGLTNRTRQYTAMLHRGSLCNANLQEQTVCNVLECGNKTDCAMGQWGDWSADCYMNVRERSRTITEATRGGAPCISAALNESKQCDPTPTKDCVWETWTDWSDCSHSCDGGQRDRERSFAKPMNGGSCIGDTSQVEPCGTSRCVSPDERDCELGDWDPWSKCSVTCGRGYRTRQIKNYTKMRDGGQSCTGSMQKAEPCTMEMCLAADCVWFDWTEWGACTASCGGGKMTRTRSIKFHPRNGGQACANTGTLEVAGCAMQKCSNNCTNGEWGLWGDWGACSETCGSGYVSRSRAQAKPPNNCGYPASGAKVQYEPCPGIPECDTDQDCKLGDWSTWASCTATCYGVKYKYRAIELYAKGNGKQCGLAPLTLAAPCNPGQGETAPAPCSSTKMVTNCELSDWKPWDHCSAPCGGGQKKRYRTIKTPPINGGQSCPSVLAETTGCNQSACAADQCIDCKLNMWQEWGECQNSQTYRTRSVHTLPNNCGKKCPTEMLEETQPCAEEEQWESFCAWSDWSPWPTCKSDACPDEEIRRTRSLSFKDSADDYLFKSNQPNAQCFGTQTQTSQCPDVSRCQATMCDPVDCVLDDWSDWAVGMGAGLCSRTRGVKTPNNDCGTSCGTQDMEETKACPVSNEQVDCAISVWSDWSICRDPESLRYRQRSVTQNPVNGGAACQASLKETVSCFSLVNADDCDFGEWGPWGTCNTFGSGDTTCGTGYHERKRTMKKAATFGGTPCSGPLSQVGKCEDKPCLTSTTTNCELGPWSQWSACQPNLQVVRTRKMKRETHGGFPCLGILQDTKGCAPKPVDCQVAPWSDWTACSTDCEGGRTTRNRTITKYPEAHGKECGGIHLTQSEDCNSDIACDSEQDCEFADWTPWGSCSVSCGYAGQQTRDRNYTARNTDGDGCDGSTSEMRPCPDLQLCNKTDCEWEDWTDWSDCSRTCGEGQSFQHRRVAQAPFGQDAKTCAVSAMTSTKPCWNGACNAHKCIDGQWGAWSSWEACTATCGAGVTWRSRNVTTQASQCGMPPIGKSSQYAACTSDRLCPKDADCSWGDWAQWTACTSTCDGVKRRARLIANYMSGKGQPCEGSSQEIRPCGDSKHAVGCPVRGVPIDCVFTDWSAWTPCPVTCGGAQQHASRSVSEFGRNGGKACDAPEFENGTTYKTRGCAAAPCTAAPSPVNCAWAPWNQWSVCTICGGERFRQRPIAVEAKYGGTACTSTEAEDIGACPTNCGDKVFCEWSDWGDWGSCSVTCKPTVTGKQTGRRHRGRKLQAKIVAGAAKLYEEGDVDVQVQELYRRIKQADARRWQEVCAAFVTGCLSLLVVASVSMACGTAVKRTTRRLTTQMRTSSRSAEVAVAPQRRIGDIDDVTDGSALE